MALQPKTSPISREQFDTEIKDIYSSLMRVEAYCIGMVNNPVAFRLVNGAQSEHKQWQKLIAWHSKLLDNHYDFLSHAFEYPSGSLDLWQLASKYAMLARIWHHGIHSLLEFFRHRLPASLEYMLAFIYLAYSKIANFYETIPAFEDTWIECLGDISRYRMVIEDHDEEDQVTWTGVSRSWYSKASDKAPTTGRLYHHLGILAWSDAFQQSFYYAKSLCVVSPFPTTKESILTLFQPVLSNDNQNSYPPLGAAFVKAHGLLYTNTDLDKFDTVASEFLDLLNTQIGENPREFMKQGCYISISNSIAMLGWAKHENLLMKAITPGQTSQEACVSDLSRIAFEKATKLSNSTLEIMLSRIGDPNVLPYIHCTLVFMLYMSRYPAARKLLEVEFPYRKLKKFLNTLNKGVISGTFPIPEKGDSRPLPEDFALRGLLWANNYFPDTWFVQENIDEEEKYQELPSMTAQRKERIKWIAYQTITSDGNFQYYPEKLEFYMRASTQGSISLPIPTAQRTVNDEYVMDRDKKCWNGCSQIERRFPQT